MTYPTIIVNSSNLYGTQLSEVESLDLHNKYSSREDRVISRNNIDVTGSQQGGLPHIEIKSNNGRVISPFLIL